MHNEIFDRAHERILSLKLSKKVATRKLDEYAALRESKSRGLSSLDLVNIAEDLMTTTHWLLTGERDPFELKSTVKNFVHGVKNNEPGIIWTMAKNVLSDPSMAYQQVSLGPSANFQWTKPHDIKYAEERLHQLGQRVQEMSFFDLIEECFGVEIIVLDSSEAFVALGAMVGGAPFIVVQQGFSATTGNNAVAAELAKIMSGDLFWYSDLDMLDDELYTDPWDIKFADRLMSLVGEDALAKDDTYAYRRFPTRLVEAHRKAVAAKKNLGYFLEWMEK